MADRANQASTHELQIDTPEHLRQIVRYLGELQIYTADELWAAMRSAGHRVCGSSH